jgi:hypothetical protein
MNFGDREAALKQHIHHFAPDVAGGADDGNPVAHLIGP